MQQAEDFRAETRTLAALLADLPEDRFFIPTAFKGWTMDDVLGHLHMFDHAAGLALTAPGSFRLFAGELMAELSRGRSLRDAQIPWLDGLSGRALLDRWQAGAALLADTYAGADPGTRVPWLGPDMSARSAITARQMETWAHGHEIFDLLGRTRAETDRIGNIVHLGVHTYDWTFANRGLAPPGPRPQVVLTAPSGALWEFAAPQTRDRIEGSALEFAQVVTQTRNIADTALVTRGPAAAQWMALAQCFAGPPEDPPAPGSRRLAR